MLGEGREQLWAIWSKKSHWNWVLKDKQKLINGKRMEDITAWTMAVMWVNSSQFGGQRWVCPQRIIQVGVYQFSQCVSLPLLISHSGELYLTHGKAHGSSRPGLLHGKVMLPLWGPAQRSALGGFAESPFNHRALCQQCSSLWPSGFQMTVLPDVLVCIFSSWSTLFHPGYPKGPNPSSFGPPAPPPDIFSNQCN